MNKLFVRLAASGVLATSLGAPALAGNTTINTTGPGSTNTVTSINDHLWRSTNHNLVDLSNWNNQWSRSGNVWAGHNTWAGGGNKGGSGKAHNINSTGTGIHIDNDSSRHHLSSHPSSGHSSGHATIHLTGPDSHNHISYNNHERYSSKNHNQAHVANYNSQSAHSGSVYVSGNTVVHGAGLSSGSATNTNHTATAISLDNGASPLPTSASSIGSGGSAILHTTGPDSYNRISHNNHESYSHANYNDVDVVNANHQSASSGNVAISHNTVVSGGIGSGDAHNTNHTGSSINIQN